MNRFVACLATVASASTITTSSAQYSVATPPVKPSVTNAATSGPSGGFLVGTDDCSVAHRAIPGGNQPAVAFTTGTTGAQGQTEGICLFFGTTGINNDVWFDWTASVNGNAAISTCSTTTVDSKIAIWPGSVGCPAPGTSIACNDDACGLQTTVGWPVTAGVTYTVQVGTFPGAAGGSGTFSLTENGTVPLPCGQYDDGVTENALGLNAGGETGWLHNQQCFLVINDVQTAYGSVGGTNPPDGSASKLAVYEDLDCDENPTTGMSLVWSGTTVTTNTGTDILNSNPTGGAYVGNRCSWVLATATQPPATFPAPMDTTNPTPRAWVVGSTTAAGGSVDINNLNANPLPPLQMQAIGFPSAWLLRAVGLEQPLEFPTQCFGDSGCPCANDDGSGGGCANSTGTGAILAASGTASLGNDQLVLSVTGTPNTFGLFFQGDNRIAQPALLGDGLRCCGDNAIRIGTYLASGNATDTATGNLSGGFGPPISTLPGQSITPGNTLCYQWWYRDGAHGACNATFNTSNAVKATWIP